MTPDEIIKSALKRRGTSQRKLAEAIGTHQGCISTALGRNNGMGIQFQTFYRYLDALDYDIVVRPRESEELADELLADDYSWGVYDDE